MSSTGMTMGISIWEKIKTREEGEGIGLRGPEKDRVVPHVMSVNYLVIIA